MDASSIKYGAGAPIELEGQGEPALVRLTVRDRGIGIPVADQERIFQRFERAASERQYGGLGIGPGIGTIFALTTSGTGYAVLHYFEGQPSDGANPFGALSFDAAGNLYGTTAYGGSSSNRGTLFTWP